MLRNAAALLALAAVVVIALVISGGGAKPYTLKVSLPDADGLRQGAPVSIAGQDVGNIDLGVKNDRVIVTINVDRKFGPIGRDATASINSVNLLGQKRIEITKGNTKDPAPQNYQLPSSQVTVSADLNQVLDVLTPDVRARLAIVLNEAGLAVTGREADISSMLEQLPPDFSSLTALVQSVANNNNTLGALVKNSDGFVSELNTQHRQLVDAIDTLGQTSATLAQRKAALTATIAHAPRTLVTLDSFLAHLKSLTVPLGPAATDITDTAPELQDALAQIAPFTKNANPVLQQATSDAPELTDLAVGATPVLKQVSPVLSQVATLGTDLQPVSATLNNSADNLVAILQNWSRAIQLRDGLSHVFRGEASVSPYTLTSLINTLQANPVSGSGLAALEKQLLGGQASTPARTPAKSTPKKPATKQSATQTPASPSAPTQTSTASSAPTTSAPATSTQSTGTSTSSSGAGTSSLSSLLGYLLKP